MVYIIQDKETRTPIDFFNTKEEAENILNNFEEEDKKMGEYTEDFYEIVESNVLY